MHHHPHPPNDAFDAALEGVDPLSLDVFKAHKRSMVLSRHLMMTSLSGQESHPGQAACLLALSQRGDMSQSDLADALHVSRPTVTVMLQKLEAAGAIDRRTDEHDQRVTRLSLTPSGAELAERMRAVHADVINSTIGRLSEADRRELLRLLTILNGHAAGQLHGEDAAR